MQASRLEYLKCQTFGSEMLPYEVDLKTCRYFGGNIPETPLGLFIFWENENLNLFRISACHHVQHD